MDAAGSLTIDGETIPVTGDAWFDHQWGDFIAVGAGGWDWFAVNLADGTDVTLSLVRDAAGGYPLVYGTLVRPDGSTRNLTRGLFDVTVTDHWTSPSTGAVYPAAWHITIPDESLVIDLVPTVADQELDTRATTGVIYWEGSQLVHATRAGVPVQGEAYVELTGYAAMLLIGAIVGLIVGLLAGGRLDALLYVRLRFLALLVGALVVRFGTRTSSPGTWSWWRRCACRCMPRHSCSWRASCGSTGHSRGCCW